MAGDGRRGTRAGRRHHPTRTHGAHLEHDQVARDDGGTGAGRGDGVEHGVGALETSDQVRFDGVVVDKKHLEVAATNERFADVLAEADDGHDGAVGKGGR